MNKSDKKVWDKYWNSSFHQPEVVHQELVNNLKAAIGDFKGKKILEVGAGMGGDSLYFAKQGGLVTVLDFSQTALDVIKKAADKQEIKLELVKADASKMPFGDGQFDIVFHQGFLEHFKKPLTLLEEQSRVLKKDGFLAVDVPQLFTTYTIKKHFLMLKGKWFAGWERQFSPFQLKKLIKRAGFEIIGSYGWGYYGKLHKIKNLNLGGWYKQLWNWLEKNKTSLYLNFSIGVIARKK